jgi:peptide deformylase
MIQTINTINDEKELAILRKPCETVLGISDDVVQVINDLAETGQSHEGCVGLAANQIWKDAFNAAPRVFVLRMDKGWGPVINPEVTKVFKRTETKLEGCMSVPKLGIPIERAYHIVINYLDGEGTQVRDMHLYGLVAREFLHELDHLDGKVITDYAKRRKT